MTLVRDVKLKDVATIREIYRPFIENSGVSFELEMPDMEDFTNRVRQIAAKFPFCVLEQDGEILGYAYASSHRERAAYRWSVETSIYMHENARGKGLGEQLYSSLMQELIKRKFTLAYGIITQPNPGSVALHKKCGFTEMAMHKNAGFKAGKWHDVLWMERPLAPCLENPPEPDFHGTEL